MFSAKVCEAPTLTSRIVGNEPHNLRMDQFDILQFGEMPEVVMFDDTARWVIA